MFGPMPAVCCHHARTGMLPAPALPQRTHTHIGRLAPLLALRPEKRTVWRHFFCKPPHCAGLCRSRQAPVRSRGSIAPAPRRPHHPFLIRVARSQARSPFLRSSPAFGQAPGAALARTGCRGGALCRIRGSAAAMVAPRWPAPSGFADRRQTPRWGMLHAAISACLSDTTPIAANGGAQPPLPFHAPRTRSSAARCPPWPPTPPNRARLL